MPRKVNMEDAVLNYFNTAPLAAADVMLKLCTKAVQNRQPQPKEQPRKIAANAKHTGVQSELAEVKQ